MLIELLAIVAPVFVITGLGALWGWAAKAFHTETVGSLVFLVGTPCLVYSSLTSLHIDAATFAHMASAAALALAIAGVIAFIGLRIAKLPLNVFLASLMHPNSGNMGIPLVFLAFGDQGLALAVSYFFVIALSQYTIGYALTSGGPGWSQIHRLPLIWAVALALFTIATGIMPPDWVMKTTTLLGNLTIPLMLLLLGNSLVTIKPDGLPLSLALAGLRLGAGLIAGLLVPFVLGLTGVERGAVFLLCCMPVAIFNFVLAERFDRMPDKVASLIFVSTLMTLLIMPLLVWVALRLA